MRIYRWQGIEISSRMKAMSRVLIDIGYLY
jgi:hypothetical protein